MSIESAPATTAQKPAAPVTISVAAVRPPSAVSVDGDLGEWGPLGGDARRSNLVFALGPQALQIAAELGEGTSEGIWLGLATTPPEVHPIGSGWMNGAVEDIDCAHGGRVVDGRWRPDDREATLESRAACKVLLDRHATLTAEHRRRFSRLFKIDREGVRSVGPSGPSGSPGEVKADKALLPIAGASAVWKSSPSGVKVEVSLPLLALPRMAEAPVTKLGAWARPATSEPPEIAAKDAEIALPEPVSFEPLGELRARVLEENKHQLKWGIQYGTAGQSYQPGDPLHIESMHYDGPSAVVLREGALFEKKASLGDIEVGYVHAFHESLAIFQKGKLLSVVQPRPECSSGIGREDTCGCEWEAHWEGMVTRDGAIHVFLRHDGGSVTLTCGVSGSHPGGWSVLAIAPDGSHREAEQELQGTEPNVALCQSGKTSANDAMDAFGWRGDCILAGSDKYVGIEMTKRWDGAKKKYVVTWRRAAPPKKK